MILLDTNVLSALMRPGGLEDDRRSIERASAGKSIETKALSRRKLETLHVVGEL